MQHAKSVVYAAFAGAAIAALIWAIPQQSLSKSTRVPEFTHRAAKDWLNSAPLSLESLRGKAVLVEFWTFDCINCRRSIPWMKAVQARFTGQDLQIVAVHTPELAHEKQLKNVVAAVSKLGITYPVMIDLDYSYWNALDNRYWPAFYLIDKRGVLREIAIGELHVGESRARSFEQHIASAVSESVVP